MVLAGIGAAVENREERPFEPVLFSEEKTASFRLGFITLNHPRLLNALNLRMLHLIAGKLQEWRGRADIVCVVLNAASERAFCSGGDVKSLLFELREGEGASFVHNYFTYEYFVDYSVHCYPKPVLCWADGITMGGGIGIMNGASHRVVTERTWLAMPEIFIGLFPDVGGTYFLNRLPEGLGLFLGLTGARFDGLDAVAIRMAEGLVSSNKKPHFFAGLLRLPWTGDSQKDKEVLSRYLVRNNEADRADGSLLLKQSDRIQELTDKDSIEQIDTNLRALKIKDDWFQSALQGYFGGSPTSAKVIFEQMRRGKDLSLKDAFLREWDMAIHLCGSSDFYEGVRARLLDRDNRPRWNPPSLGEVKSAEVEKCFTRRPVRPHPLNQMIAKAGMDCSWARGD
ncbi:MAG TPA: hypothetical protein DCZ05_07815 [Deltaproteobacteria bacterium]|nr:hypothetical protein [Deltaproteobacteria bacterium]